MGKIIVIIKRIIKLFFVSEWKKIFESNGFTKAGYPFLSLKLAIIHIKREKLKLNWELNLSKEGELIKHCNLNLKWYLKKTWRIK